MCFNMTFPELSTCSLPLQDAQVLELAFITEHSILAVEYALYNKGSKGRGSTFNPPMQVTTQNIPLTARLVCVLKLYLQMAQAQVNCCLDYVDMILIMVLLSLDHTTTFVA